MLGLQVAEAFEGENSPKSYEGRDYPTIQWDRPDIAKKNKGPEWRMWYIAKGKRSEGVHGMILNGDQVVTGKALNDTMVVDGQVFVWLGPWDDRKQLFSKSGWLPLDIKSVYPSWQIQKSQAPGP